MKPKPESQSLNFLIDFLNVKTWGEKEYRLLEMRYRLIITLFGKQNGYEEFIHLRKFGDRYFFIGGEETEVFKDICCPGGKRDKSLVAQRAIPENDFYTGMAELQADWRARLEAVREKGHDYGFLAEIASRVKWQLIQTTNPYTPQIGPLLYQASKFDDFLEFHYLNAAINHGDLFKKTKTCAFTNCQKVFVYVRTDQKFCSTACRDHFNNHQKINSGYLRDHQRKGREENPDIYIK